jgi:hypothetical protein
MNTAEMEKKIIDMRIFLKRDKKYLKKWLVKKLIDYFSTTLSDSALETKVIDTIKKTVQLIRSLRQRKNPLLSSFGNSKRIVKNKWRKDILYGVAGNHPTLLDDSIKLNEVIERRIRTLEKMKYYVGRSKNIFRYPSSGEDDGVNPNAMDYWSKKHADVFYLSVREENPGAPETGMENPTNALYHIFNPPSKNKADRNKLFCQQVATIVLMDSLVAIDDINLLTNLANINQGYLRIGNPYGDNADPDYETFFSIDNDNQRMKFENEDIDFNDLQLGDHVHVKNHEAYNILAPDGMWQGEHAFITEITYDRKGNRKYRYHGHDFKSGLLLAQMRKYMLRQLRNHFKQAQRKIITFYMGVKEEDGITSKPALSNGSKNTLSYGYQGLNNITRDTTKENELSDEFKYACWCIEYPEYIKVGDSGYWGSGKLYFFKEDGNPNEIELAKIPEMPFTIKSNTPYTTSIQVIRPKTG